MPFTYFISQVHRVLRETLAAPPIPQVALSRTYYVVHVNGTIHHVRRDRVCDCSGTPRAPCPAIPHVQDYLASGREKLIGRHPDTWPETWIRPPRHALYATIPPSPIDASTVGPDPGGGAASPDAGTFGGSAWSRSAAT